MGVECSRQQQHFHTLWSMLQRREKPFCWWLSKRAWSCAELNDRSAVDWGKTGFMSSFCNIWGAFRIHPRSYALGTPELGDAMAGTSDWGPIPGGWAWPVLGTGACALLRECLILTHGRVGRMLMTFPGLGPACFGGSIPGCCNNNENKVPLRPLRTDFLASCF